MGVTRTEHTAAELRALSSRCSNGDQVRRMLQVAHLRLPFAAFPTGGLAIAMVLEGRSRTEAAELNGMDRQTLRDWVHRDNGGGLAGLKSRKAPGGAPAPSALQKAELLDLALEGPGPDIHGGCVGAAWT